MGRVVRVSAEPIDTGDLAAPIEEWTPQDWALAKLTYLARRRPLKICDLASIDRTAGRLELIDGVLLLTANPDFAHGALARQLANQLDGLVPAGCAAHLEPNVFEPGSNRTITNPDVVVYRIDRAVRISGPGEGVFPDGLALAIEITSSNRDIDLGIKRQRYEAWGVPYLVIDRSTEPFSYLTFGQWPSWASSILPTESSDRT